MKLKALLVLLPLFQLSSGTVFGDAVSVGISGTASVQQSGLSFSDTQKLAVQFTLNQATEITTIEAAISNTSASPGTYSLAIVDELVAGHTLWTSSATTATNPTFDVTLALAAGTYYLVGPISGSGYTWHEGTGVFTEQGGTVEHAYYFSNTPPVGAVWTRYDGSTLAYQINGMATSSVPEPSSVLLLLSALIFARLPMFRFRTLKPHC